MDEEQFRKLRNKRLVGPKIQEFWRLHGFPEDDVLAELIDYTNLGRVKKGSIPQWPKLVDIVHACKKNLSDLIDFIDPPQAEIIDGIEIQEKHRPLFVMLATILKNSEAISNERRIVGITVNLEDISARSVEDLTAAQVSPVDSKTGQPIDKEEFSRSQVKRRLAKAREPTRSARRKR